jgi:multiple sugar transport system substrate-binding protein
MAEKLRVAIRKFRGFEIAIERQFASWTEASGSALELEYVSLDLNPLVESLFADRGLKRGEFDVAFICTDWLADASAEGALLDLAPLMAADPVPGYPDAWAPSLLRQQTFGDSIYGLPYHDGPECLIYRKDLFDDPSHQAQFQAEHGYRLAPPRTWTQFEEVAPFFTHPENDEYGTIFAGFPDGHNTVYDFCLQLWSRGGALHDASGTPTLDTAPARAGLDFYRQMIKDRSATPPGLEQIDSVKSGELFVSSQIAMMVNWFGFAALCEQPGSPVKGKIDVAPLPTASGEVGPSLLVYWVLGVGAGSRHREAAYEFIRHCVSPQMDKITTLEGGIGCRRSTWQDPEINAMIPFFHKLAGLHETARELPRSRQLPTLIHVIDRAVQAAITTDEPTAAILAQAQREAAEINVNRHA